MLDESCDLVQSRSYPFPFHTKLLPWSLCVYVMVNDRYDICFLVTTTTIKVISQKVAGWLTVLHPALLAPSLH